MTWRFFVVSLLVPAALAGLATAIEAPVAVSPGSASRLALASDACPTFSWSEVAGATRYELTVYSLSGEGLEPEPVLREGFAGSISSWTPSLDRCLERGGLYGWSVRAVGPGRSTEWAVPSLFKVAPEPSSAELREALMVLRRDLETPGAMNDPVSEEAARQLDETSGGLPTRYLAGGSVTIAAAAAPAGDAALQVNGSSVVTEATLATTCVGRRWLDQGNGTVRDCVTQKVWLKDAGCLGSLSWGQASTRLGELNGGSDLGCADYTAGVHNDWRLPETPDFCSSGETALCHVVYYSTSLLDRRFSGSPKVCNSVGDGTTTDGDPFVHVASDQYWTATLRTVGQYYTVNLTDGEMRPRDIAEEHLVWPVRGPG